MKKEDYIDKIEGAERRVFSFPVNIDVRENENNKDKYISGVAAVVGSETNMGWYDEVIAPGAFDSVLNNDVRCLFNHDPNQILARSNNGVGTLSIFVDENQHLAYSYKTPNRSYALDLEDAVTSGDIDKSSFAFRVKRDTWVYGDESKGIRDKRTINEIEQLYDVSPVTYPAYQDTSVAKRSMKKSAPIQKTQSIDIKNKKLKLLKNKFELNNKLNAKI